MPTTIARWGNSLAVRIPAYVADAAGLHEGDAVQIDVRDHAIVVQRTTPRLDLAELVSRITPENRHDEIDWGTRVGREAW